MTKVLVTGAAGLIGQEVISALRTESADFSVTGLDSRDLISPSLTKHSPDWVKCDITAPEFPSLLNHLSPDLIIHAAAHPGGRSSAEPARNVEVNAFGSVRLFEWCAKNNKRVLYLSSSIVYGDSRQSLISESEPAQPGTVYGVAKVACESWLRILERIYGLDWVALRPFSTYGSGHQPGLDQGIVNVMLTQLSNGTNVICKGSLNRQRDLLHVSDAARAITLAVTKWPSRQVINVCTGHGTSIAELIDKLISLCGMDRDSVTIQEIDGTVGDPLRNVGNPQLGIELLGFASQTSVDEGLKLTCQNVKSGFRDSR